MGDTKDDGIIRKFDTGATRDTSENKLRFDGFLSPSVIKRYAEYMHKNRTQSDGSLRDPDNWQKGIPKAAYIDSGWRHFFDWWGETRGLKSREGLEEALCGLMFNAMGYLHEVLKEKEKDLDTILPQAGSITWLKPGATLDEFFDARYKELGGRKDK